MNPIQYQVKTMGPWDTAPTPPPDAVVAGTVWDPRTPRRRNGAALSASGGALGGDWSTWPPLPPLEQPKPRRPGLRVHPFGSIAVEFIAPPPANVGEWFRPFSEPFPHHFGLKARNQVAIFETVILIPVPPAQPSEYLAALAQPIPKRPGLKAANQLAYGIGWPNQTGPATTVGTWHAALSNRLHKQRQGPNPASILVAPFTPPFVPPPPPPVGGGNKRRHFIRRGKVF